jgi:aspartate/methionine/tyrosine aminotransferase
MREFPASPITALIDQTPRYNLGESIGADLTVAEVIGASGIAEVHGVSGVSGVRLGYGTSAGDPELRGLIAARHGIPDRQVLVTAGAAAALFLVSLLCGDGEVVLGQPGYPPTLSALRGIGAPVVTVLARFEDGYRVDLDAFARRLSPRTQLVIFASPQNPSGVPLTEDEVERMLAAMARVCPEALLLIDETFREATYGGAPPAASFAGRSPRLLTCGSISKAYGAPGLRIGWLTVPEPGLYEQLRLARFNTALSCGSLDEFLAARLLSQADRVLAARGAVLAGARGIVERWIKGSSGRAGWLPPQAGGFCCLRLEPGAFGPEEVGRFHAYLAEQRVLVAPGPWFGDSANIVRLGLAYEPADRLEQGLAVVGAALEATAR